MKFLQHIGYAEDGPLQVEANSIDEILNHAWLRSWSSDPYFQRWSISVEETNVYWKSVLMAEFKGHNDLWSFIIIGYLTDVPALPKFGEKVEKNSVGH